jgi:SAM-dependent methyltransferase
MSGRSSFTAALYSASKHDRLVAPEHDRERLRTSFGTVADMYDRARPTYPAAVYDDLGEAGGLGDGARVLELGPGTGKATVELARRGYEVVAVELSPDLAAVARRNLEAFPKVDVVTADFETWEGAPGSFDAVVAFTAFHWIDPDVRFAKAAALLREHGSLGVIQTNHVLPREGDSFWEEIQDVYAEVVPHPDNGPPPPPEEIRGPTAEVVASGLFDDVVERRHLWTQTYGPEYVDVLGTYSSNIVLPAQQREELFRRIAERIEARPGGRVTKHYLATLAVGRRS